MKQPKTKGKSVFGATADYMTAGIDKISSRLSKKELGSPQGLPGIEKPPTPLDDQKQEGMSMGELLKEKTEDMIDRN